MTETRISTDDTPTTGQKFAAELLGTFVLVFFGVGAALMSNGDYITTGLTFGLTVVVMAYAFGRITGGHFNPAVTLGAVLGGRLPWRSAPVYVGAQLLGGLLAGAALFGLMHGYEGFSSEGGMGANSFGDEGSGYALWAAFLLEMLLTMVFLYVILAVTDQRNEFQALMGPLAIGFALAMIHFASMGATGTSVNPARSIGVGVFGGIDAIIQLWLFILAPLVGAAIAGLTYPLVFGHGSDPVPGSGLSFRSGKQHASYAPPATYEQQWNQGQPQWQQGPGHPGPQGPPQWQPAPDPYAQPVQHQQQPVQPQPPQQWAQPPAQPAAPPQAPQHWVQPAPDPYSQPRPQQPPAQQWGQPVEDDGEDGRTQVRRPD